jgi:hypothetical protein
MARGPEEPECSPALAVLGSKMLAGDRQAPYPLSWPRPGRQYCMMRRRGKRDPMRISITVLTKESRISHNYVVCGCRGVKSYTTFPNPGLW